MQSFIEKELPKDGNDLCNHLDLIDRLMAESGNMLADAKYYRDTLVNGVIMEAIDKSYTEKLTPSTINKYVDSAAREHNYLVNWIDRINASAVHIKDSIRTIISYRKKEMEL